MPEVSSCGPAPGPAGADRTPGWLLSPTPRTARPPLPHSGLPKRASLAPSHSNGSHLRWPHFHLAMRGLRAARRMRPTWDQPGQWPFSPPGRRQPAAVPTRVRVRPSPPRGLMRSGHMVACRCGRFCGGIEEFFGQGPMQGAGPRRCSCRVTWRRQAGAAAPRRRRHPSSRARSYQRRASLGSAGCRARLRRASSAASKVAASAMAACAHGRRPLPARRRGARWPRCPIASCSSPFFISRRARSLIFRRRRAWARPAGCGRRCALPPRAAACSGVPARRIEAEAGGGRHRAGLGPSRAGALPRPPASVLLLGQHRCRRRRPA